MTLSLASRRLPLTSKKLSSEIKAQLVWILEREGAGPISAASKDEEWRDSLEVVDVCGADGSARYQLWLWPSGSAVMFEHGTTNVVAEAAQHELVVGDAKLRKALGGALEGAAALGVVERVSVAAPARGAKKVEPEGAAAGPAGPGGPGGPGGPSSGVAEAMAAVAALKDPAKRRQAGQKLFEASFGKPWNPYPKRSPHELTADQRQMLEAMLDGNWLVVSTELHHYGLVSREDRLERYLGRAVGPSDVRVRVGTRELPLWVAVTHVGSGDLEPEPVLAAFRALPKDTALAAWAEMARGEVCDIDMVHPRKMAEAGIPRTPGNVKHRTRLFGWLADACVALGEPGRKEAERILATLPKYGWGHRAFVATMALSRHARASKAVLDPRHDAVIARLHGHQVDVYAEPLLKEIVKGLPPERAGAVNAAKG